MNQEFLMLEQIAAVNLAIIGCNALLEPDRCVTARRLLDGELKLAAPVRQATVKTLNGLAMQGRRIGDHLQGAHSWSPMSPQRQQGLPLLALRARTCYFHAEVNTMQS